jgi:hypothetical protein
MHRCTCIWCNCHFAGPCGSTYWELCPKHWSYFWNNVPSSPPTIHARSNIFTLLASKIFIYVFFHFLFLLDSCPCFPVHKMIPLPLPPFSAAICHWFAHCPVPSLYHVSFPPLCLTLMWYKRTQQQQAPLKLQYVCTKLHDITSNKNVMSIFTIMRTCNLTNPRYIYLEIRSRLN